MSEKDEGAKGDWYPAYCAAKAAIAGLVAAEEAYSNHIVSYAKMVRSREQEIERLKAEVAALKAEAGAILPPEVHLSVVFREQAAKQIPRALGLLKAVSHWADTDSWGKAVLALQKVGINVSLIS